MDYKVFWTQEAIRNLEELIDYLYAKWTQREVDNFILKLFHRTYTAICRSILG